MAPEVLNNQPYEGTKVDIFAAGVILFEMITCHHPFNGEAMPENKLYTYMSNKKYDKFWNYHIQQSYNC